MRVNYQDSGCYILGGRTYLGGAKKIGESTAPTGFGSRAEGDRLVGQTGERLAQAAEPLVAGESWLWFTVASRRI